MKIIAIDPGFGGNRSGPAGCDNKIYAKDINLQIAKKVAERIKKDLGINVLLTRDDDVDVSLEESHLLHRSHPPCAQRAARQRTRPLEDDPVRATT